MTTPSLSDVVETLSTLGKAQLPTQLARWLDGLDENGRWALLKLVTGALRIGVSARLAKTAAASLGGKEPNEIEMSGPGSRRPTPNCSPGSKATPRSPRRATSRRSGRRCWRTRSRRPISAALDPKDFIAEWKWDGIRVQAVDGPEAAKAGSRGFIREPARTFPKSFPDLTEALRLPGSLDGELLIVRDGRVQSFNVLQQRLNRKAVTPKMLAEFPAHLRAYDLLVDGERRPARPAVRRAARAAGSIRGKAERSARRSLADHRLRHLGGADGGARRSRGGRRGRRRRSGRRRHAQAPRFDLCAGPAERPVVEVEARPVHGRCGADVCPARPRQALVVLFRLHLRRLDRTATAATSWCRSARPISASPTRSCCRSTDSCATTPSSGSVRCARSRTSRNKGLVFEVAFEGLQRSTRHKSGVAMRFPRISRLRWDKPPREADRLETLGGDAVEDRERARRFANTVKGCEQSQETDQNA